MSKTITIITQGKNMNGTIFIMPVKKYKKLIDIIYGKMKVGVESG